MTALADPYTMEARLCDDQGMVSDERQHPDGVTYLDLLNNLRPLNQPWTGGPFTCTGNAHLAGEHIRCTSPAHQRAPEPPANTIIVTPA